MDLLGNFLKIFAGAYALYQTVDFVFRVVQNALYEDLQRRVPGLETASVLLVDPLPTMVRVWVIDAFRAVDRKTGSARGEVTVTLLEGQRGSLSAGMLC